MTITFNELRRIKDELPDGSVRKMAIQLGLTEETIRNYFGGDNYTVGTSVGLHIEPGPDGGLCVIDDTTVLDMALSILGCKEDY
jgi:hypothetical protein